MGVIDPIYALRKARRRDTACTGPRSECMHAGTKLCGVTYVCMYIRYICFFFTDVTFRSLIADFQLECTG